MLVGWRESGKAETPHGGGASADRRSIERRVATPFNLIRPISASAVGLPIVSERQCWRPRDAHALTRRYPRRECRSTTYAPVQDPICPLAQPRRGMALR